MKRRRRAVPGRRNNLSEIWGSELRGCEKCGRISVVWSRGLQGRGARSREVRCSLKKGFPAKDPGVFQWGELGAALYSCPLFCREEIRGARAEAAVDGGLWGLWRGGQWR